jgi:hypothetical protein
MACRGLTADSRLHRPTHHDGALETAVRVESRGIGGRAWIRQVDRSRQQAVRPHSEISFDQEAN